MTSTQDQQKLLALDPSAAKRMSEREIQSWVAEARVEDRDDSVLDVGTPKPSNALDEWTSFLELSQRTLLDGRLGRLVYLNEKLLAVAERGDLDLIRALDLFSLLTLTYPRYVDVPSRTAVLNVLRALTHRDSAIRGIEGSVSGLLERIIKWIDEQASQICSAVTRSSSASSDRYILLTWCCALFGTEVSFTLNVFSRRLVPIMASLFDSLCEASTKDAIKRGALAHVRRTLRMHHTLVPDLINSLIGYAKSSLLPFVFAPMVGVAVDVSVRLKPDTLRQIGMEYIGEVKGIIMDYYMTEIFMSRTPVPVQARWAFRDFVVHTISEIDLVEGVLPVIEKVLLRSPEIALPVVSNFLSAYNRDMPFDVFPRLLTASLHCGKSVNGAVRTAAIEFFGALVAKLSNSSEAHVIATNEILALPKASKTTGAEHRAALYAMLSFIKPSSVVSPMIAFTLPDLLAKESSEAAVRSLHIQLAKHFAFILQQDISVPASVTALFVKETTSQKALVRRAFFQALGNCFWILDQALEDGNQSWPLEAQKLVLSLRPALENNIKTLGNSPLNAPISPSEGYIAVFLGFCSPSPMPSVKTSILQGLALSTSKPSFLLWDKVYGKLATVEDELWFLRALSCALLQVQGELKNNEKLRLLFGYAFLHASVGCAYMEARREALSSLKSLNCRVPHLFNPIIREALVGYILQNEGHLPSTSAETSQPSRVVEGLIGVVLAIASFDEATDIMVREELVAGLIILTHHPAVAPASRQLWIEATQAAQIDPAAIVHSQIDFMISRITESALVPSLNLATKLATKTLAFIAPEIVVPRIIKQINLDLDPKKLVTIGQAELNIWKTEEGVLFLDVLHNKKVVIAASKGKDNDIEKWEAEVREIISTRKASSTTILSRQDRALVDAQLQKESATREAVQQVKRELERGLGLVQSLVAAKIDQFQEHVWPISTVLLDGVLRRGFSLAASSALATYLTIASSCSSRLGAFRTSIGIATLRSLDLEVVPEDFLAEPLGELAVRLLYEIHSLSEKKAFDAASFSFMSLFLCQVLEAGGVGQTEAENALEQVTLALEIIQFHGSEFSNRAFPRLEIIRVLLSSISRYPQISKSAVSALVDIGNGMKATATLQERVVLIRGTLAQQPYVRNACLQAIQTLDLSDIDWSPELFLVCHDENKQNSRLAARIWEANYLDVEKSYLEDLLPFLAHENYDVRENCARALVFARVHFPSTTGALISNLKAMYQDKARILPPEYDGYGMLVERSPERHDPWVARKAIALTFEYLAEDFPKDEIVPLFSFLLLDEALGDRNPDVRRGMLNVGTTVIDFHGKSHLPDLLSMFEHHLALKGSSSEVADYIREALVILLGRLAKHLDSADARVPLMVDRLVEALRTPSEVVQSAVAECLSPLIVPMGNKIGQLMERLLQALTTSPKYAERRGAAYGLAGVIHGLGISALKEFSVITRLRAAMDDKKNYEARQGALFAFETMSGTLGRLFEPYIAQILPLLLAAYGDQIPDVREATQDASRVIMGNMSGYCLKLILPSLLGGLEEKQWRTKKGSIELLGAMAFLAPNQLSVSLPTVIPRLTSVLTDSHAQVRSAANKSLKQFGEVINNPEIRSLVPVLLKALVDPEKTLSALTALLRKSFVHYIDSPSLALLIPILERGMKERGAETKRKAAQIVGNMASLTGPGDFVPYLPRLIPLVHTVLVDPVPEARATAAKALGTLIERLGETNFPDLVSSLLQTLKTDSSGVDRQGAAQGLSEVLSGLGMDRMEGLLPDIISGANSNRPYVREGFMSLLVFLPATFGHRFAPHLSRIIPPILSGLADAEEYVRAASMKAGRMIIANYSNKAIDLLLPELERGMFDSSWRIRHSSVTLVGELLYKVSGISGKNEIEEEEAGEADPAAAESSRKALVDVLGKIRRDRILGALYIIRQDAIPAVRQASIHIWKALIHNTPRTVREILPSLIERITGLLATDGDEEHETAARTIGELCRKQGEKILSQIVPIFRRGADSPDPRIRQGVCLALGEVLQNTTDSQREGHEDEIISAVRVCLVDDSSEVRAAAAHVFDVLQEYVGGRAIDQTIPTLLEALCYPGAGSGTALQALREIMTVRASTVFPVLIPTLIASPITAFNAHALASLVTVAGTVLSKRLTQLLTALVGARESEKNEATLVALDEAISALVGSVEDAEGLHTLMMLLLGWSKHYSPIRRVNAVSIFATFCENTELEFSTYRVDWIRQLVTLLDDRLAMVYEATWKALDEFVKSIDKSEMDSLVVPLRRTIESTGAPGGSVPGFGMAKGISPMLPIIFAGLTGGSNEQREQAALAIADIVERTDENALRPYTTQLTGPLIRVITQATTSPPAIKSAILVALIVMLERIPTFVKPFFPQLQRTFVKALTDSSLSVRLKAVTALTVLMRSQPRVDPLVTELISAIRSHEDAIAGTIGTALAGIINSARSHVGQASFEGLLELVMDSYQDNHDDNYNSGMGEIIGALAPDAELVRPILQKYVLGGTPPHPLSSQILVHTVTMCPTVYYALNSVPSMIKKVQVSIGADQPSISRPAREVKDLLRSEPPWVDDEAVQGLL